MTAIYEDTLTFEHIGIPCDFEQIHEFQKFPMANAEWVITKTGACCVPGQFLICERCKNLILNNPTANVVCVGCMSIMPINEIFGRIEAL